MFIEEIKYLYMSPLVQQKCHKLRTLYHFILMLAVNVVAFYTASMTL